MGESVASAGPEDRSEISAQGSLREASRGMVLLVEDDDTIASLVTHILRRSGRTVLRASDGAGCVKLVREHRDGFALVILDCRLPDMDGTVLCRELREMVPNLPVLMTSGKSQPPDTIREAGATAFLPKPFRPADVERQVTTLIGAIT